MYGFPKLIATRQDIEHLMGYMGSPWATPENKQRGLAYLGGLLNTQHYVFDRNLAEAEQPDGPEPQYIVLTQEDGTRRQEVLADNPAAPLYQMGLTATEVQAWIAQIEGAL
ncbi:MAG: hypothetical protein AB1450_13145 [Pseudomonadota bacterium]